MNPPKDYEEAPEVKPARLRDSKFFKPVVIGLIALYTISFLMYHFKVGLS